MEILELWNGKMLRVHDAEDCSGEVCPIHNPTDHEYRSWGHGWTGVNMLRIKDEKNAVVDPDDYLFNKTGSAILSNSAECRKCQEWLHSEHRHDFQRCKCGDVFVDGGYDYIRHGWTDKAWYVNTSVVVTKEEA